MVERRVDAAAVARPTSSVVRKNVLQIVREDCAVPIRLASPPEGRPFDSALSKLRLRSHYFQQDASPRASSPSVGRRPMDTQGRLWANLFRLSGLQSGQLSFGQRAVPAAPRWQWSLRTISFLHVPSLGQAMRHQASRYFSKRDLRRGLLGVSEMVALLPNA